MEHVDETIREMINAVSKEVTKLKSTPRYAFGSWRSWSDKQLYW